MSFWYNSEDPAGAIQFANEIKMPLLVFVADGSNLSQNFDTVFSSGKADQVITGNYIAIRLGAGTPEFNTFNDIIAIESKPSVSIFLEGNIRARIDACEVDGKELVDNLSTAILTIKRLDSGESVDTVRESLGPNSGTTLNLRPLSDEERAKKEEELRLLIEKRRKERLLKEQEEEKKREAYRREQGKTISAAVVQKQEKEAQMLMEKKRKEKQEDRLAKQRVLEKIARDKAERAARLQPATHEPAPVVTATPSIPKASPGDYSICKLGFRFPDSSTQRMEFDSSIQLGEVRGKLQEVTGGGIEPYAFVLAYPHKRFSADDEKKTLLELGLCPSNSIVIKKL